MKRQQMNTSGSNGVDHISGLSEPIIHSIFSLLSPDDLRNIPILSKHFNSLWTRFPIIYFHLPNDVIVSYSNQDTQKLENSPNIEKLDNFLAHVKRSIQLRYLNTVLKKFSLRFNSYDLTSDPRIDEIIHFALENNVQELDLLIGDRRLIKDCNYKLMEGFQSTSLTDLYLTCIHFDINLLISSCPCLKSLIVTNCSVSESEYLRNITSYECLRELEFSGVRNSYEWIEQCVPKAVNLVSLKVSLFSKLKEFRVTNQKLENLEISHISFEEASRSIQVVAPNLRSLSLGYNLYLTDKWLKDLVYSLQNLENFKIRGSSELRHVDICNDSIRSLELLDCDYVVEVAVNAKKLSSFIYRGRVIVFTLMNTSSCFNSTLELNGGVEIYETGADEEVNAWNRLRKLLSFFSHCETMTLVCFSSKDFIIPQYIKAGRHPLLYGLKHLKIKHHKSEDRKFGRKLDFLFINIKSDPRLLDKKPIDIKIDPELIDNFLWLSPHLESLSFAQGSGKEKIIKLYYDSEKEARDEDCCRGLPLRYWRDDFRDIELKNFDATDNKDQLWKYFDKSAILGGNPLPSFARSIRDKG